MLSQSWYVAFTLLWLCDSAATLSLTLLCEKSTVQTHRTKAIDHVCMCVWNGMRTMAQWSQKAQFSYFLERRNFLVTSRCAFTREREKRKQSGRNYIITHQFKSNLYFCVAAHHHLLSTSIPLLCVGFWFFFCFFCLPLCVWCFPGKFFWPFITQGLQTHTRAVKVL